MFETLTGRLNQIFDGLKRRGKLSVSDVDAAMREVRLALLEADVHYTLVKDFIGRVRERAIGAEVSKALNPGQQVIKIVNDELIKTLGLPSPLNLSGEKPRTLLLVGLQGSGKTTAAGKLAGYLRARGERVMLVAGDPYRPAAAEQLRTLGQQVDVPVFFEANVKPPDLVKHAFEKARNGGFSVIILDTAGRSQLDDTLMVELQTIVRNIVPTETLLVVDAMIGQEALHVAEGFHQTIPLTGLIMSKMDGDSRGGAAISIRSVTGIPIKFIGTGEKLDALEVFQPERLASRILGMGDVLGLIEKAEAVFDEKQAQKQAERLSNGEFTLEDLAEIMRSTKKMGPMSQMMDMLPGDMGKAARAVSPEDMERQFKRTEAIISSMTPGERRSPEVLNASRRRRIAAGSGTEVQDVNQLIKQYREMHKLMKTMQKTGGRGLSRLFG
ncbi:MAG: signal recognition particle protein [Anaerolineales bacterium]|jgi:signal recognition particle subunit SRP54